MQAHDMPCREQANILENSVQGVRGGPRDCNVKPAHCSSTVIEKLPEDPQLAPCVSSVDILPRFRFAYCELAGARGDGPGIRSPVHDLD
jgi:hypothetical protein